MSWEKIGITVVTEPKKHGSGVYLRVSKKVVDAYDLLGADKIEFVIRRVRRPPAAEKTEA